MFVGLDLGTSAVKAVLIDGNGAVLDQATSPLEVSRPRPMWSEQDPATWWRAADLAMADLAARNRLSGAAGLGLSGQMHGAVLLDRDHRVLRHAILWNDGRSVAECEELERREPRSRSITGNLAMPGFTAPKLIWVARHEPEIFERVAHVLLPKDWLRLRLTGELATDPSDAAGTLWLDTAARRWSPTMLATCGLSEAQMPRIVEGTGVSGGLRAEVAAAWGLRSGIPVAGGGGDNAAGAVGVGVIAPGTALLSLGTSGVIFVSDASYAPDPDRAVHTFCHCVPDTWHRMSVILSAASCLDWLSALLATPVAELLSELERGGRRPDPLTPLFLPYLTGERTPHNDANATAALVGLRIDTPRAAITQAVLEGVAFALADGLDALEAGGRLITDLLVIGGGARSPHWGRILASGLGKRLVYPPSAEVGPALGAALLARAAVLKLDAKSVTPAQDPVGIVEPDCGLTSLLADRRDRFKRLYPAIAGLRDKSSTLSS